METDTELQFAVTARTLGHPRKLYTPLTVVNFDSRIVAKVNAMWDTGAEYCIMSEELAKALRINFDKMIRNAGVTGQTVAALGYTYVTIVSHGGLMSVMTAVVPGNLGGDEYSFIIGLNMIRRGTLCLSHTEAESVLTFKIPSGGHVDYVAEAGEATPRQYLPLSQGKEDLRLYYEKEALRLIADVYPDSEIKNYIG